MRRLFRLSLGLMLLGGLVPLIGFAGSDEATAPAPNPSAAAPLDPAALKKKFQETLDGSVMVGQFTMTGKPSSAPERYTITAIKPLAEDFWVITPRIQYGDHDVTVPIPLRVLWAGDTPIITVTDLTIPGLGTYSARVMIYDDQYAGVWSHGKVGGHLWGKIEKPQN